MVSSGFPGLCRIVLCLHGHILPHGPREQTGLRKLLEVAARITESTVNWLGQDLGVFPCDRALFNPCTYMHAYALRPATLHIGTPSPVHGLGSLPQGLGSEVTLFFPTVSPRKPLGSHLTYLSISPWGHGRTFKFCPHLTWIQES